MAASPTDLSGLAIWYQGETGIYDSTVGGSAVTADAATIARWEDQSGNGRHATQATAESRPQYDATKQAVCFAGYLGGNRFLTAPAYVFDRQNFSLFVVGEVITQRNGMNLTGTANAHQFMRSSADTLNLYYDGSTNPGILRIFNGTVKQSTTTPLAGTPTLFGFVGTASGVKCWAYDAYTSTAAPTSGNSTMAALFGADSAIQPLQGTIRDFVFYGRALTDNEVTTTLLAYARTRGVATARFKQAVFVGDSLTHGYYATMNRGLVQRVSLPAQVRKHTAAQSGIQAATLDTNFAGVDGARRISGERNVYAVWAGVNDILSGGKTGAQAYASVDSIRQKIQANGDLAVGITMTPGSSGGVNTQRTTFNSSMLAAGAGWDAVVDTTGTPNLENSGNATYFPDGLHLSDAAYALLVPLVESAIRPLLRVATSFGFTGPTSGDIGVASTNFTVTPDYDYNGTVTPSDGGAGGTFTPTSLDWSSNKDTTAKTFTYTPAGAGAKTISLANSWSLTAPTPITYTAASSGAVTSYTLTGPSTGTVGFSAGPFTVTLGTGTLASPVTVTPSAGGGGGTFAPSSVVLSDTARSASFDYIPASAGAKTISVSDTGGLTDPSSLSFTAAAAPAPATGRHGVPLGGRVAYSRGRGR